MLVVLLVVDDDDDVDDNDEDDDNTKGDDDTNGGDDDNGDKTMLLLFGNPKKLRPRESRTRCEMEKVQCDGATSRSAAIDS